MSPTSFAATLSRVSRKLMRAPTYARNSSALRTILKHSTPRRLLNLLIVEIEYRLRRTRLLGRPYVLVVDPTNVCNLRCPLCTTGLQQQHRRLGMIPWETYTHIVDTMAPWAFKVNMFNWGEPLLHTHLFDMIRYARERNLGTSISSNLSLRLSDERIDGLITSGLEFLCVSIDGATQESYSKYRRRGNLDLVLGNVRRLIARRAELNSRTPVIEWQFIPMKHNEHEISAARERAREMGVDQFRCIPVGIPFDSANPEALREAWFPQLVADAKSVKDGAMASNDQAQTACYFLYRYLVVNPDGKVSPCCVVSGQETDFGDSGVLKFDQLWNNLSYQSGRAHYVRGGNVRIATVCDGCDLFAKRSHLAKHSDGMTLRLK